MSKCLIICQFGEERDFFGNGTQIDLSIVVPLKDGADSRRVPAGRRPGELRLRNRD